MVGRLSSGGSGGFRSVSAMPCMAMSIDGASTTVMMKRSDNVDGDYQSEAQ
jgi:hypothetical protein